MHQFAPNLVWLSARPHIFSRIKVHGSVQNALCLVLAMVYTPVQALHTAMITIARISHYGSAQVLSIVVNPLTMNNTFATTMVSVELHVVDILDATQLLNMNNSIGIFLTTHTLAFDFS